MKQLNAVYPTHERLCVAGIMTRFICAPDMREVAKVLDAPRDFLFVEAVLFKNRFGSRNESIYVQNIRCELDIIASCLCCGGNSATACNGERAHRIPITLLSRW